jgi:sugar lactone lactonase YvrE
VDEAAARGPRAVHFAPFAVTNTGSNTVTVYRSGSKAVAARISDGVNAPKTAAFDVDGNLYIANARTVAVYARGSAKPLRTIARGISAPAALAFDHSRDLYVANQSNNTVSVYGNLGAKLLRTISRGIDVPDSLAFDSLGNLYVANRGSSSGTGSSVTIYAPGKTLPLRTIVANVKVPLAVALDGSNNLFVANVGSNDVTVYKAGTTTQKATIQQGILVPSALAFDGDGRLYVSSLVLNRVTVYAPGKTGVVRTISKHLNYPVALAIDSDILYVTNLRGDAVTAYALPSGAYLDAVKAGMSQPSAVALAPAGAPLPSSSPSAPPAIPEMLFVSNPSQNTITAYALPLGEGPSPALTISQGLAEPYQLGFDSFGNLLVFNLSGGNQSSGYETSKLVEFVAPYTSAPTNLASDVDTAIALAFVLDGSGDLFNTTCGVPGAEETVPPYTGAVVALSFGNDLATACSGIATDGQGDLFVQEWNQFGSGEVREYQPPITTASLPALSIPAVGPTIGPEYLAFAPDGDLFVASPPNGVIDVYAPPFSGAPAATISIGRNPPNTSMLFDAKGNLYFTDFVGVYKYAPPYTGKAVAYNFQGMKGPIALALSASGNLYVFNHVEQYGNENYILEFSLPLTSNSQPSGYVGGFSNTCCTTQIMAISPGSGASSSVRR